jgi:hypothetical protein
MPLWLCSWVGHTRRSIVRSLAASSKLNSTAKSSQSAVSSQVSSAPDITFATARTESSQSAVSSQVSSAPDITFATARTDSLGLLCPLSLPTFRTNFLLKTQFFTPIITSPRLQAISHQLPTIYSSLTYIMKIISAHYHYLISHDYNISALTELKTNLQAFLLLCVLLLQRLCTPQ